MYFLAYGLNEQGHPGSLKQIIPNILNYGEQQHCVLGTQPIVYLRTNVGQWLEQDSQIVCCDALRCQSTFTGTL